LEGNGTPVSSSSLASTISLATVKAILAFVAALLLGRYAIKPLFRFFSQTRNEEVFTAMALLVVLATAAATGRSGLSLTLGAFLGGMIISETPYRHLIQTEAKPFRNLLLGFFFITVGMSLDWRVLLVNWAEILAFLVILVAVKTILIAVAARVFGWSTPGSVQLGFLLAQGSEFVFVIIAMPTVRGALGETTVGVVITGVAASLACTPSLAALGNILARKLRERMTASVPISENTPRTTLPPVIIYGMDEVGRTVADALEANGIRYEAVDSDHERFLTASADGYLVAFGNPIDVRLMETLAYSERKAIVVSHVGIETAEALKPVMQDRYPNLTRFIAVNNNEDKQRFEGLGLHPVINRSFPRGIDLAATVLRFLDIEESRIQPWMQRQQERALKATSRNETVLMAE
ncbi:MAG: cation:proton antiporter, partial [Gammaproteobacteria bacterium]